MNMRATSLLLLSRWASSSSIMMTAAPIPRASLPPLPSIASLAELKLTHGFSESANWLVPGKVLLGANPTKGRGQTINRVKAICNGGGCDTFVSLQAELPPITADPSDFDPNTPSVENYGPDAKACVQDRVPAFRRFPIDDLHPASSVEYLAQIVDELAALVRQGHVLYIHCFAGRGRTGLVACCLLGKLYEGMSADEALERIGTYYSLRALYGVASSRSADGMSPETEPQRQQVREYFARYTTCDTSTGDDSGPDPDATRDPASRS